MSNASPRPLYRPTRRDHHMGKAWVATQCFKRSYGLVSCMYKTQTNVWELYKTRCHLNARVNLRGIACGCGCAKAPLAPPVRHGSVGAPPNFSPTFPQKGKAWIFPHFFCNFVN
jgi:hypothetical protein